MKLSRMTFDGALLDRGYWIYAIRVVDKCGKKHLYIGRTGDNSSKHAGSPFQRIAAHLNLSPSAKANSLTKRIREKTLIPSECEFRLAAVGPIFPEQGDFAAHKPFRNRMTAIEKAVADHFRGTGYEVLGTHHDNPAKDPKTTASVIRILEEEFLERQQSPPPCGSPEATSPSGEA